MSIRNKLLFQLFILKNRFFIALSDELCSFWLRKKNIFLGNMAFRIATLKRIKFGYLECFVFVVLQSNFANSASGCSSVNAKCCYPQCHSAHCYSAECFSAHFLQNFKTRINVFFSRNKTVFL